MFAERRRNFLLIQEERKYISRRKKPGKDIDYPLAAGQRDKPMMNYRCSHILETNCVGNETLSQAVLCARQCVDLTILKQFAIVEDPFNT